MRVVSGTLDDMDKYGLLANHSLTGWLLLGFLPMSRIILCDFFVKQDFFCNFAEC